MPSKESSVGSHRRATPFLPRRVLYAGAEETPIYGALTQSYDHPVLNASQERTFFGYLQSGVPIEEVRKNTEFINSFDPEDRPKVARILDQSATVEEALCACYFRLVHVIAKSHWGIPLSDGINAGNAGLLDAIRRFDLTRGTRLSTFAPWYINASIHTTVKKHSGNTIPNYVSADIRKVRWVQDAFRAVFGRESTKEELRQQLVANLSDLSLSRIDKALSLFYSIPDQVVSINRQLIADSKAELADTISGSVDTGDVVIQHFDDEGRKGEVRRALEESLTEEERRITKAVFGIDADRAKTLDEIAEESGCLRGEVEDILSRSISKLKDSFRLRIHEHSSQAQIREKTIYHDEIKQHDLTDKRQAAIETLTDRQRQVLELLQNGLSQAEIAIRLGVSKQMVSWWVRRFEERGICKKKLPVRSSEWWVNTLIDIKALWIEGLYFSEIAEKVNLSAATVSKYVKKFIDEGVLEPRKITREEEIRREAVSEETELVGKYLDAHPRSHSFKVGLRRIFELRERRSRVSKR